MKREVLRHYEDLGIEAQAEIDAEIQPRLARLRYELEITQRLRDRAEDEQVTSHTLAQIPFPPSLQVEDSSPCCVRNAYSDSTRSLYSSTVRPMSRMSLRSKGRTMILLPWSGMTTTRPSTERKVL